MKVWQLIEKLLELETDYDIGLADEEHGVVQIRAVEADEQNKVYRLI